MSEMSDTPKESTKEELLKRMREAYANLEEILRPLSAERLEQPGAEGWAVKDHLAHLATWELGIVALLEHRPRFASPRLEEAERQGKTETEINDIIYQENATLNAAQAIELFREGHRKMLRVIESMSNEDLYNPYDAFLPAGEDGPSAPVLGWIVGNSYEHYNEHAGWIKAML